MLTNRYSSLRPVKLGVFLSCAAMLMILMAPLWAMAQSLPNILEPTVGTAAPATQTAPPPATASGSPASGSSAATTTELPTRLPVAFDKDVPMVVQDGTLTVRGWFTNGVGPAEIAKDMRNVVVRGTMQVEEGSDARQGTVTWTSVQRPDTTRIAPLSTPLASKFATPADELKSGQTVNAAGDYQGVIDAVAVLYGHSTGGTASQPAAPAAAPVEGGVSSGGNELVRPVASEAPEEEGGVQGGGEGFAANGSGSDGDLSEFELPETIEAAAAEAEVIVGTTYEGCSPLIDLANDVVTLQTQLTQNGSPDGNCSNSGETFSLQKSYSGCGEQVNEASRVAYPMYKRFWTKDGSSQFVDTECQIDMNQRYEFKKSYSGCTDDVDRTAGMAYARFRNYYVDGSGTTQMVDADCQRDEEAAFALTEDRASCLWNADYSTMVATPQAELVYTDRLGQRNVVDSCAVTTAMQVLSVPIVEDASRCSYRHDYTAGVSYSQSEMTYTRDDGVEIIGQACSDDGVTFAHQTDTEICDATTDLTAYTAIPRYQLYITTGDNQAEYISNCTPDTENAVALTKTGSGCETTFFHNVSAGQSNGAARFYHTLNGSPEYVTTCEQDTDVTYAHEESTVSWQHNDVTRSSQPLTRLYFNAPGVGEVEVSSAQVRAGAPDVGYTLSTTEVRATGTTYTDGSCDKYTENANFDVWLRADNTEFEEQKSVAASTGPTNACAVTTWPSSWPLDRQSSSRSSCQYSEPTPKNPGRMANGDQEVRYCYYTGAYVVTREDGEVIINTTDENLVTQGSGCGQQGTRSAPSCSSTITGSSAQTWNDNNGWIFF